MGSANAARFKGGHAQTRGDTAKSLDKMPVARIRARARSPRRIPVEASARAARAPHALHDAPRHSVDGPGASPGTDPVPPLGREALALEPCELFLDLGRGVRGFLWRGTGGQRRGVRGDL